jgi:hypothetical protein
MEYDTAAKMNELNLYEKKDVKEYIRYFPFI